MNKTEKLKIRGFKAKLPKDFGQLVAIKDNGVYLKNISISDFSVNEVYGIEILHRNFSINLTSIYFQGSYHKNPVIRFWQKIVEYVYPNRVLVTYIPIQDLMNES